MSEEKIPKKVIEDREQVENKLRIGIYEGKNPLAAHKNKFKLELYKTINPVYEGERLIDDYFVCSQCLQLFNINVSRSGTNQFRRHFNPNKNQCKPIGDVSDFRLSREDLVKVFVGVGEISSEFGIEISQQNFLEILPQKLSTDDDL